MLTITIEGRQAAIKKGSSFDFVRENPLFSEAEDFTLNISFPLKDCPRNVEIFGYINRHGHKCLGRPFHMSISSGFNNFKGTGVIASVSDIECKVQFLAGKASENYYSDLDQIFINNLDLGEIPSEYWKADDVPVSKAWAGHAGGMDMVALPYVNEGTGNIINNTRLLNPDEAVKDSEASGAGKFMPGSDQVWKIPDELEDPETYMMYLSWFPYLIDIAEKICSAIGFSCDFSKWRNSKWNELLLCHAVPATWNYEWATLMPHWSVLEFFRNLEPLIEGEFSIDMISKSIRFDFYSDSISAGMVELDKVIDEFESEVYEKEQECSLISERYLGYADNDSKAGRPYSCAWLIRDYRQMNVKRIYEFDTPEDLQAKALADKWRNYLSLGKYDRSRYWLGDCSYIKSQDRYVSNRVIMVSESEPTSLPGTVTKVSRVYRVPVMLNAFGPRNVPELRKDAESVDYTLQFVPAVVDDTDNRRMLFLPLGDYEIRSADPIVDEDNSPVGAAIYDSATMKLLEEGEDDGSKAYFSNMAVGFYPGAAECSRGGNEIYPILDNFEMDHYWAPWYAKNPEYTLSLDSGSGKFAGVPHVNSLVKFEFTFISDTLPDVRSVFLIRGHRYLCEKLTANFSEDGMSQKIKGTFWRIL